VNADFRRAFWIATVSRYTWCGGQGVGRSPDERYEVAVISRERTLAKLAEGLARVTAELNDDEFLRLLTAMLDARSPPRKPMS